MPVGACGRWLAESGVGRGGAELVVLVVLVAVALLPVSLACRGERSVVVGERIESSRLVSAVLVLRRRSAVVSHRRRRGVGEVMVAS